MAGAAQLDQLRPAMAYSEPRQTSAIGVGRNFHTAAEYDLTPTTSCEDVIMREMGREKGRDYERAHAPVVDPWR